MATDKDFSPTLLDEALTRQLIRRALAEDLTCGPDVTSLATIPDNTMLRARVVMRHYGVVAALNAIKWTLEETTKKKFNYTAHVTDGQTVDAGTTLATIIGPARELLTAERTALNIVCHASGIATTTRLWVEAIASTPARVRDSRKTLPGMRNLQKYAVACGGGVNHRYSLADEALIKDNHVCAVGSITTALNKVRQHYPHLRCEVEVDTLQQLEQVLALHPHIVMLDNFDLPHTKCAVNMRNTMSASTLLESSGGLTLEVARDYALCGVDFLAVGSLTHSVMACDIGLDCD